MNTATQERPDIVAAPPRGVIADMAAQYRMDPVAFERTLRATVFPGDGSKEQFAAFLLVAREFNLNPLTKQIYAFPDKRGGVVPIVPIDGWMAIINRHPEFDGMEFIDQGDAAGITAITCKIYRKDRGRPTEVTEYMSECKRPTEPWKQWPARMLRHKAAIQCGRYAFALSGISDPDEAERIIGEGSAVNEPRQTQQRGAAGLKAALTDSTASQASSGDVSESKTSGSPEASADAAPADRPAGTLEQRDGFIKKFSECSDVEVLALAADELRGFEWSPADQAVINDAYTKRKKEIEQA